MTDVQKREDAMLEKIRELVVERDTARMDLALCQAELELHRRLNDVIESHHV